MERAIGMDSSREVSDTNESEDNAGDSPPERDTFEEFEDEDSSGSSEDEAEKDQTEIELENFVFGDDVGFQARLKAGQNEETSNEDFVDDGDRALATVDDSDLFFQDTGQDADLIPLGDAVDAKSDHLRHRRQPAWEDSEDERMMISLMSVPRLRKLRQYEGEDVISGREYIRRLRQQFESLNPRPKWADWKSRSNPKRQRRGSVGGYSSSSEASSEEGLDGAESDMSTQPLAQLLQGNFPLTQNSQKLPSKRRKIQPEVISVDRMKDIQPAQPSAITCIAIHPNMPLLLSAGPSSMIYLHHLIPHPLPPEEPNPLITSMHLTQTPISTAAFSPAVTSGLDSEGPRIYLSSRRRYFHVWNLPTGTVNKVTRIFGHASEQQSMEVLKPSPCGSFVALKGSGRKGGGIINILDAGTLQWTAEVRVESHKGVADFCWWRDGSGMTIAGKSGELSEWSAERGKIVARWQDEGAFGTTTIALGGETQNPSALGPDRWIAIGSTSGIVNIYDRGAWTKSKHGDDEPSIPSNPKPTKSLDHLTTPISQLMFSPCGQILAMASRWKRDALRLVHLPSCSVFRNWPTAKTPLGRISALTLGEYWTGDDEDATRALVLAVGNEAGSLRAWELGN